jgi:hypothetical protein
MPPTIPPIAPLERPLDEVRLEVGEGEWSDAAELVVKVPLRSDDVVELRPSCVVPGNVNTGDAPVVVVVVVKVREFEVENNVEVNATVKVSPAACTPHSSPTSTAAAASVAFKGSKQFAQLPTPAAPACEII